MVEPSESDIGRMVIYRSGHGGDEEGVIISVNSEYVFVRYKGQYTSAATRREDLEWALGEVAPSRLPAACMQLP